MPEPISLDALARALMIAEFNTADRAGKLDMIRAHRAVMADVLAAGTGTTEVLDEARTLLEEMDAVLANAALVDLDIAADEAGLPRPSAASQAKPVPAPARPVSATMKTRHEPLALTPDVEELDVVDAEIVPETTQQREQREQQEWRRFHKQRFGWYG